MTGAKRQNKIAPLQLPGAGASQGRLELNPLSPRVGQAMRADFGAQPARSRRYRRRFGVLAVVISGWERAVSRGYLLPGSAAWV